MFGQVPGFIRFVTDPKVWRELSRLRQLAQERYGSHLRTSSATAPIAPLPLIWKMLTMHKIVRFGNTYIITSFLPPFPSRAFETLAFRSLNYVEYGDNHRVVVPPLSTHVAITNRCPLGCWHCSKAIRPGQQDMPTERWLEVLAELQEWGVCVIAFSGGEPLVHPRLEEMIAKVDRRSITYIFTSGVGLNEERARRLKKAGLFGVLVSLDHYDEAKHDAMRGYKGAYAYGLRALEASNKAGMYTMLQTVASKELLHSNGLRKMLELGRNMRVHEVRILPPIPTGRLLDAGDDVLLSEEERRQIIQTDKQVNGWLGYPKMSSSVRSESVELFGCGAGSQHSYIDAAGNVYPCDFVPLSFGNVAQRSFRDIWCEVATTMGGTRNQCFMHENVEAVRQAANGQLPLPPEVSHRICRDAKRADSPDFFRQWGQMWQ